jgi:sugar diacid utilization regulator/putative methionine-R-sulfoxide reductase with GAF domain
MRTSKRAGHLVIVPAPGSDRHAERSREDLVKELDTALRAMADAAVVCDQHVKEVAAAHFVAALGGRDAVVIERAGNGWVCTSSGGGRLGPLAEKIPATISMAGEIVSLAGIGLFIPVKPGVGILADCSVIGDGRTAMLRSLAVGVDLALTAATQNRVTLDATDEIGSLQQIAKRILSAAELDEVLFSITRETTRLLNADIGGVFLRDDDELVMRSCVGNDTLDIDRLRMKRGQGLAGLVFDTGRPCKVDDYLSSELLNRDFFWLARDERIRCALGAPLRAREGVIGVLEVWRRRNVPFTEKDVHRVVALANLTTIAIQNARLYESQKAAVQELTVANDSLRRQNEFVRLSAELQDDVIQALLDGRGVAAIARVVARYAAAEVAILGADLVVMSAYPANMSINGLLPEIAAAASQVPLDANNATLVARSKDRWLSMRPIVAGGNRIGWVCALCENEPGDIQEIAIRQAAVASALYCLEQRSASQARASALGALMWDLLEGMSQVRQSALSRLMDFNVDIQGPHRVIHGAIDGLAETAREEGWNGDTVKRKQRAVHEACERALGSGSLKLIGWRGDLVVAIVAAQDAARTTTVLKSLHDDILAKDGVRTFWGVSAPCAPASELPTANREAMCAALAAAKLGTPKSPVVVHEQLGVLTLLLPGNAVTGGGDLRKFMDGVLGPVLEYDPKHRGVLTKTIRAYLDNDCSLKLTARKLFVHEKTVRYRLSQFEELTGVDLRRHKDRMSVDLALLMHAIATRSDVSGDGEA